MSTIATQPKSVEVFSHHVAAGSRSFFFNVKRAPRGEVFLMVHELTSKSNTWSTSKILVPAENMKEFYLGLCEAIKVARKTEAEFAPEPVDKATPPAPRPQRPRQPVPAKPAVARRATGRAAQSANRNAITSTSR